MKITVNYENKFYKVSAMNESGKRLIIGFIDGVFEVEDLFDKYNENDLEISTLAEEV